MFEHLKKIFLFVCLAYSISLIAPFSASAQKFEGKTRTFKFDVMSAADFANKHGGKSYVPVLTNGEDKKIICGDKNNLCNAETEICLKCSSVFILEEVVFGKTGEVVKEVGYCAPREDTKSKTLQEMWPSCTTYNVTTKGVLSDETVRRTLSIESSGFLIADKHKELGITWSRAKHRFKDSKGKKYELYISDSPTIQYAGNSSKNDDDSFNGCEVLPVKIYNHQSCFFCPLAGLIYGAANDVTSSSFESFAHPFKVVLVVMFAIWLALAALGQVFPMTKQDAPKFLSAILKQGFKFLVAFLLLTYANDLFRLFIIPVLDSGLQLGTKIQALDMPAPVNWEPTQITTIDAYYNLPVGAVTYGEGKVANTLFGRIELFLASVQAQLSYMQAIGTTIFCVGGHEIITVHFDKLKIGLRMMLLGGVLTSFGFLLTIAFAFYFLDALLQLAVIGAMLPFMIAGWPYKATAQYASIGFKMLLNTFFVMFFTGFVISVNIGLIDSSLSVSQNIETKIDPAAADNDEANVQVGAFEKIVEAINAQDFVKLNAATDIGGVGFMLLAFSCVFGFKFVAQTTPLANTLSSGGFKGGVAGKIGTMAGSAAKGMATKAAQPIAGAVADQYHAAGGLVGIVSKPVASLGGLAGKAVGGGDQEGKKWSEKSFRGKVGAVISKTTGAPHKLAKKVHSAYRKPAK